ncbi:cation diffusion facilitator family transporter [Microlunatus panaciterrae]|uniref:Cobalt-zinc-cadmium efflux system protein n=1 Tax=Microlunatus panaciterrae TaxID=400768 RepID=A0ABS2RN38_9ACTN|nr:cation diffusion facilitator family transporter [Microlunatus panaciterrae]MBM7800387.1 cobalt-zinc-cadmium efflux system protein [Microlunatus panaciterrae]
MAAGHGHAHGHAPEVVGATHRRRLAVVFSITLANLVAQLVGAGLSGSLALIADAGHLLTDALGLLLALTAASLMLRAASRRRTWGFHRAEVLAAAVQALVLVGVGGYVVVEAIRRLISPPAIATGPMIIFGGLGLVCNITAMLILLRDRSSNLNLRAAFLEVLNDALGSMAVIVAAIVIATTGWRQADAVVSLLIGALILPRSVLLLRDAGLVLLESTPKGLDLDEVRRHILELPHVHAVHDLHASQIATGIPVLTAHVVVDDSCFLDGDLPRLLDQLQSCVADHFAVGIEHSTFQFEPLSHQGHEPATHD